MVTVYSSPTCVYCYMVKEYLNGKKVKFKEVDISVDPKAAQWVYENTGYMATPVVSIGDSVILGFDRPKIDLALREAKLV
jgi:glutaredoxin 3